MGDYDLVCVGGGETVDEHYTLSCSTHSGLLRTVYRKRRLEPRPCKGMFKFYDWLPVRSTLDTEAAPIVFKNEALSRELDLPNLWIGFTGYYPERGAKVMSCTFKEMEALPTYARLKDNGGGTVVVASAGNTARAFAEVSADADADCVIVVPERSKDRISVTRDGGHVRLYTVKGDYADAIQVADRMTAVMGYVPEGGARNVARRDGMGTVMLEGALTMGRIPDHYFQAVGSGTGGISAWEASLRLIGDGRFGNELTKLNLSQNSPFAPMAKAWRAGRRTIGESDLGDAGKDVSSVYADVLTNRKPPYSPAGGVFDAMAACDGVFWEVSNSESESAERFWMSLEQVRPDPAASVAFASLIKAVDEGGIDRNDHVLLNMTGGGLDRVREDFGTIAIEPVCGIRKDATAEEIGGIMDV